MALTLNTTDPYVANTTRIGPGLIPNPYYKAPTSTSGSTSTYNPFSNTGTTTPKQTALPSSGFIGGGMIPAKPVSNTSPAPTTGTSGAGTSSFPFSAMPQTGTMAPMPTGGFLTGPSNPSPTVAGNTPSNFNPNAGVSAGTFSATKMPYNYGGQPQADTNVQAQMNVLGQGNPFQNQAQGYAQTAGQNSAYFGGQTMGQGMNQYGGANAVMNTAFDPQNALYDRTKQQVMDSVNANEAARGITMSPYGAGVANKAMSDFNIDWQNNQLARQTQGLQAATGANTAGANLGTVGTSQINQGGQLPYETGQAAISNEQQSIQDWLNYLAGGTSASAGNVYTAPGPSIIFGGNSQSQFGLPYAM